MKMANYDNNNRISIWKNENREKDTQPHYKGNGMVDGKEYWISAWRAAEGANPKAPVLNISLTAKDDASKTVKTTVAVEEKVTEDFPF